MTYTPVAYSNVSSVKRILRTQNNKIRIGDEPQDQISTADVNEYILDVILGIGIFIIVLFIVLMINKEISKKITLSGLAVEDGPVIYRLLPLPTEVTDVWHDHIVWYVDKVVAQFSADGLSSSEGCVYFFVPGLSLKNTSKYLVIILLLKLVM